MSGDFLITLLQFILALGLLLFFHELGHFVMARLFHIPVEEFGFGFPPRMVKLFTWQGTDFTLNWIPFGAFVRPRGENDPDMPGGLAAESPWKRLGVLLGGPVMNLLVGVVLFTAMFMRIGAPNTEVVQVAEVVAGTPAETAGLLVGDQIVSVNGAAVRSTEDLSDAIQANLGQEVTIVVDRAGAQEEIRVTPRQNPPEDQGPLGIVMGTPYTPVGIGQALPAAVLTVGEQARQLALLPVNLIRGQVNSEEARVVGPKGMFDIYAEARRRDVQASASPLEVPAVNVLWLVGSISVALGLTNLLPIPALDGGRIIFVLPELLFRRKIPARYENLVHLVGFAALLLLMGYITFQDFANPIVR